MKKKIFIIAGIFVCLTIISTITFILLRTGNEENNEISQSTDKFTFRVTIPENTPTEDIIFITFTNISPNQEDFPMEKVGAYVYELTFSKADLEQAYDFPSIQYRYNRNGWGFPTTEYLPEGTLKDPDIDPIDETGMSYAYRVVQFEEDKIQEDSIDRWRWFPEDDVEFQDISKLKPTGEFKARIGNEEFRSGLGIEDLYVPQLDAFFDKAAKRIKDKGFKWVVLYPPEQMKDKIPFPEVVNDPENNPNYPNVEKLNEHIEAFKKQGLKVYIEPQLCCDVIDTSNRTNEWYEAYADEVEKFLVRYAKISEKAGVDALLFDTFGIDTEMKDYNARINEIFDSIREVYSGEISTKVLPFLAGVETATHLIPEPQDIPIGSRVDFFIFDAEGQLSPKDNPTEAELLEGASEILDISKQVHDMYGKPVLVRSTYASIKESWKGPSFYQSGKIPAHEDSEFVWQIHEYSGYDLARVDHAYMSAIKDRPWVIGFVHFGYTHWDMPLYPDWNIRAKEGEDVLEIWNEYVYS